MPKPTLTNTIEYIKGLPDCAEKFEALYLIKDIKKIYTGQENSIIVEMSQDEYKNYEIFKGLQSKHGNKIYDVFEVIENFKK